MKRSVGRPRKGSYLNLRVEDSPYYLLGNLKGISLVLNYRYKDDEHVKRLIKVVDKMDKTFDRLKIKPF